MIKEDRTMDAPPRRRDIDLICDPEWKNKFEPLIFFGNAKDFNELLDQFENYARGRKEVNEIPPSFIVVNVGDTKAWIYLNHLADENNLSESTMYDIYYQLKSSDRVCTYYPSVQSSEELDEDEDEDEYKVIKNSKPFKIAFLCDYKWDSLTSFESLLFIGTYNDIHTIIANFKGAISIYGAGKSEHIASITANQMIEILGDNVLVDFRGISETYAQKLYNYLKNYPGIQLWPDDKPKEKEEVNHPARYNKGGIEVFDILKAYMGKKDTMAFDIGCVIKYVLRFKDKGGLEDLKKARVYLDHYILLAEEDK